MTFLGVKVPPEHAAVMKQDPEWWKAFEKQLAAFALEDGPRPKTKSVFERPAA